MFRYCWGKIWRLWKATENEEIETENSVIEKSIDFSDYRLIVIVH